MIVATTCIRPPQVIGRWLMRFRYPCLRIETDSICDILQCRKAESILKIIQRLIVAALFAIFACATLTAQNLPAIRKQNGISQLIVHGKPFLILGGEVGNSSAGTAAQADTILPKLARLHFNTVLMPVAWNQMEPEEGHFDVSILDHWIESGSSPIPGTNPSSIKGKAAG